MLVLIIFDVFGADPSTVLAGQFANEEKIETIRQSLGLSEPWWVQLGIFLRQVATFDYGRRLERRTNRCTSLLAAPADPELNPVIRCRITEQHDVEVLHGTAVVYREPLPRR